MNATKPVSFGNLSPVVRQILSKDPSYAVRFGGQLSKNKDKKYLFDNIHEQQDELKIYFYKYQKMILYHQSMKMMMIYIVYQLLHFHL